MPTVLRVDGLRFFFFSDEHLPLHIHVEKADSYMRVELEMLNVTDNYKFSPSETKKVLSIIRENMDTLRGAWNEYFNNQA